MQKNNNKQPPSPQPPAPLPSLEQLRESEQRYHARKRGEQPAAPLTDSARAYIARMQALEKAESDTSIAALMQQVERRGPARSFKPYPYAIDEAYPLALQVYESRLAALGRKLIWESDAEAMFRELVRYFIGDASGMYNIHRGIFLFGGYGSGKTIVMQALQEFTRLVEQRLTAAAVPYTPRSFRFHHCRDIAMEVQRTAATGSLRQYFTGIQLFDDLGNEDEKKIFGNEVNAMAEILLSRYNAHQHGGPATHCTSNLAPHECALVYGDRIGSRIFELFNHVYWEGGDKRRM